MIKAILLDLDNTLIVNNDRTFAREFLQHADRHFADALKIPDFSSYLRHWLRDLSTERDGTQTNLMTAYVHIAAATGHSQEMIQNAFTAYYTDVYPHLAGCVKPLLGAADIIQELYQAGYTLVIATNPIYPLSAVKQRMSWGQLPVDDSLYTLITAADNMHFAKPDPAYYAEILGRIGVEPDEAILVGDSPRNDMAPARSLGIHTFFVGMGHCSDADYQGSLTDFVQTLNNTTPASPPQLRPLKPAMIAPQYRGNVGALYGLLTLVRPSYWHQRPDPDEWSILQILCHLYDAERSSERLRLERILREDNPFIVAPRSPGADLPICDDDGSKVATWFVEERQKTLKLISDISPDDWQRTARHSIFGLTTFLEMAHFTAQHDRLHLAQLCQTLGRCEG